MATRGRWAGLLIGLLILALVLAACGGASGMATATPAASGGEMGQGGGMGQGSGMGQGGEMGQGGRMEGDPERGRQLFEQSLLGEAPGCSTCHSLEPGKVIVGPSLAGIGTRAAERIQDPNYTGNARSAEGYIRESIMHPDAYVVEGFPKGVMYQNYRSVLSMEDFNDLVAFLMTLK